MSPLLDAVAAAMTADLAIAAAVAVAAGLMRGYTGFGSGMLMAPIFAILYGPVATVAIIILLEIVATVQLMPRVLGEIEWRFVTPLGIAAVLFMPIGATILGAADPEILTRVMAALVLLFVLVLMTGWRYAGEKKLIPTLGVGAVSGTLMAATSVGNPPVLIYMLSSRDTAATNRANIIAYFAITQGILLLVLFVMGLLTWLPVAIAVLLTPGYLGAAWLGSRLFRQSNERLYRRVSLVFLLGVAAYGLLR